MKRTLTLLAATTALATPAFAEDLSVVGSWSSLPLHNQYEAPFWTETLPGVGDFNVSLTTHNQMNLGLADVYRLLGDGVYDVAMTVADYAVADAPELEGLDGPLSALTADEARAMVASFATKYEVATPIIESYAIARRLKEACAAAGAPCPVIDSADILADPSGMLRNLCAALDIEFDVAMLSWPAGSRSEDGPWAPHWYDAVNASSGFRPPKPTRITLTPALEEVAAACLGDYHALAQGRLSAGKSP